MKTTKHLTFCPNCQTIQARTTMPFTWEKGNVRGLKNEPIWHAFCCIKPGQKPLNFHGPLLQISER